MGRYAIFNGLVYGGGTDVIPNPEGTPTDELHSLQIGDDIYEIVGGGGSGGNASLDATTLYDTPITSTGTYTLADDYNNYDFIGFKAGNGSTETDIRLYAVKDIQDSMNDNLVITNNVTNSWFNFTINENELTIPGKTVSTIYSVIGYKIKGGGSSNVEANPTGTPTDTLNTIGIDGTIYDIKGSGGGDGYKLEKIFDGNVATTGNITLNKSISNYDELLFVLNFTRELGESYITTFNVDVSIFKNIGNYTAARGVLLNDWSKDSRFAQVKYVDDMTIDVDAIQVVSIVEIYGVKLESSGGGTSEGEGVEIYSENEYIVGKWIDGKKLYQKTYHLAQAITVAGGGTWTDTGVDISDIETLIDSKFSQDIAVWDAINGINDNGVLKATILASGSLTVDTITLRYTKTVETPAPAWGGSVTNNYANFIDTDNVIYSTVSSSASDTYTATEDCYIMQDIVVGTNVATVQIDGETVAEYSFSGTQLLSYNAYLKKGQIITVVHGATSAHTIKVFGISYSSGGSESRNPKIEYSTEEKEVGTWIDGSKIYQKTIHITESSEQILGQYIINELIGASFFNIINSMLKFGAEGGNNWNTPYFVNAQYNSDVNVTNTSANNLTIISNGWKYTEAYITVQYTKTTS